MADKTAFDILFDKLSDRGMNPVRQISERSFVVPGADRMSNTKYIITRNKKDFVNSPIMAILPEEVGLVG